MMACRGARWLGWAALLLGAVVGGLRAQDTGTPRWAFTTGNTGVALVASSPAVGPDGTIYFGVEQNTNPTRGYVFALNRDGSQKWRFDAPDWVDSTPAIGGDGTLYFGCWDGKLYAVNAATGAKKWEFSAGTYIISSPAIGTDGTVYFGGGDAAFHAVSSAGVRLWSFPTGSQFIESSPAVGADGTIYFGSNDRNIYALTPSGALKWRFATSGLVTSSPAIGLDGTVYIGSYDGNIYALDPNTGVPRWTFHTEGRVSASPVLGPDGTIYCGSEDSRFYAINPDGSEKWTVGVGRPIVSSAAVRSDETVIFGADDGVVRALDTNDARAGRVKWAHTTGDPIEGSPAVAADGSVYIGSLDGKLYAFNGSGATISNYSRWPAFRRGTMRSGALPRPADSGRLVNLATRAVVSESTTLITGLVTLGTASKNYLIRAVGPSLAPLGVANPLSDPVLAMRALASEAVLFANDDWGTASNVAQIRAATTAVGAFPLAEGSQDSVVLGALVPGAYTAAVTTGTGGGTGVALVEAYDTAVNSASARLINLSTRAQVGTGDRVLIPGLVIGGTDPLRLLVRAVGPGLTTFGVTGVLARPTMTVFSGSTQILTNTGWSTTLSRGDVAGASVIVGAFPLEEGSADCAALLTLNAGNYTIQVSGVGGTTGEALVEVYVLP